jgi:hypothetical protein
VDSVDVDRDGDQDIVFAMPSRIVLVEQIAAGQWASPIRYEANVPQVTLMITRPAFAWRESDSPDNHLVLQRGALFDRIALESRAGRLAFALPTSLEREGVPDRREAFDQVVETPELARCGVDALAAELVEPDAAEGSARRLVALRLARTSYNSTQWLPDVDTVAFAVHPANFAGSRLISVIGKRDGRLEFSVLRTTGCAAPERLGSATIEFNWRTVELPGNEGQPLERRRAMRVVGFGSEATGVGLVHYDGFTVHRFFASAASQWSGTEQSVVLHNTRRDFHAP